MRSRYTAKINKKHLLSCGQMPTTNMNTSFLLRGGDAIALQKDPIWITITGEHSQLDRAIQELDIAREVRFIQSNTLKVALPASQRDEIMDALRQDEQTNVVVHHAYSPVQDDATRFYLTDQLIITFNTAASNTAIAELLAQHHLTLVRRFDEVLDTYLVRVTDETGMNPLKVSNILIASPIVRFAEPNLINRYQTNHQPQDTLYLNQWHLRAWDGVDVHHDAGMQANLAWDINRGSRQVRVAVLDDGFDLNHPDLDAPDKILFPKDYTEEDLLPFPDAAQRDYHGTPCAGLIVAEENGRGVVGVAPNCSLVPIRFPLTADDAMLYDIFAYAGKHAHVLSCSWGPVPVFAPLPYLLSQQLTYLEEKGGPDGLGCVIVFAAGNYNAPLKDMENRGFQWNHPSIGIRTTTGPILNGHAAHPSVLAVSAMTSLNKKSAYSNWGREISICSPSDNWHPLQPGTRLPGRSIWTIDNENEGLGFSPESQYTHAFGGTSAAAPMVAGVAALVKSVHPALTAQEIKSILLTTTDKIIDLDSDMVLGSSFGNYDNTGHSWWFGYGRVNAYKAVLKAKAMLPPDVEDKKEEDKKEEPAGGGTALPIEPTPGFTAGALKLVAAMVNPIGEEKGNEYLLLLNSSPKPIRLSDWKIRVSRQNGEETLPNEELKTGDIYKHTMRKLRLGNNGSTIGLLTASGIEVQNATYSNSGSTKEGWLEVF